MTTSQLDKNGKVLETWQLGEDFEAMTIKCNEKIMVIRGNEVKVENDLQLAQYNFACKWR